jgi:hypothetical protein
MDKINNKYYVTTHTSIPWEIPFPHRIIGVEGYTPEYTNGVAASQSIGRLLDSETAFGGLRSLMAINKEIESYDNAQEIFWGSYRLFLSSETNEDWLSPSLQENRIISPLDLKTNWSNLISTEIPSGVDIIIPAPRILPDTILGQYARVHHLDDLLFAVGCAIRCGLLETISIAKMLESNTLIPYGNFAACKSLRYEFNEKLWACALDFYNNYYTPKYGYQRRVIDFAFERIISMALIQLIINRKLTCISSRNIWVSDNGTYTPSQ